MVFSPYRLFCFLLLKQAGIPTLQVSFTCNQMAWHKKYSIYDSHRHKHTVSLPDLWCKVQRVFIRASLSEKLLHPRKAKRYSFHPYRLMFIFCQRRQHGCHRAFSLLESVHWIISPASSLFGKLLHSRKAKRYSFHPYRLIFIFCQRRRHDCHMAFSLPESVHRIAPPMRTHGR